MPIITSNIKADERTYQEMFYEQVLPDLDALTVNRSTDGYIPGTIFEHKVNAKSYGLGKALSQALIYLCRFNRDGIPIPKNIIIVSQDEKKCYIYDSADYISYIEDIPGYANLQASTGIPGFEKHLGQPKQVIEYSLDTLQGRKELVDFLAKPAEYTKINIDSHNVYGWATYFYDHAKEYKQRPTKKQFFDEIKAEDSKKKTLKDFTHKWNGNENDFSLIMDLLNDPKTQKKLGAYYTPLPYADKAIEMVRSAIAKVPEGMDYVIIDRCAGTGNLEVNLTDEELSHCIVSTYELHEWVALKERLGNLVRYLVPPVPEGEKLPDLNSDGFLAGADALSEEFLTNPNITKYLNDPNVRVIMLENPPYSDDSGDSGSGDSSRGNTKDSFMAKKFNSNVKSAFKGQKSSKDILNLFIWSGFQFYANKPGDSYILFGPIKYWKTAYIVDEKFVSGFLFNREHFHASPSGISVIHWEKVEKPKKKESLVLSAYDIENDEAVFIDDITVRRIHKAPKILFDEREFKDDKKDGIYCSSLGREGKKLSSTSTEPIYNDNIIGYLFLVGMGFHAQHLYLTRNTLNYRKNGFYLRKDNFVEKLPLFCAKAFPQDKWYETDIYATCADKKDKYKNDDAFLAKCLIYTCLSGKNKVFAFKGSDGRAYNNDLCLREGALAKEKLDEYIEDGYELTEQEANLIAQYDAIYDYIKKECTDEYHDDIRWGISQISDEIEIKIDKTDENGNIEYDKNGKPVQVSKYGDLKNMLSALAKDLKAYYYSDIFPSLIEYELLK